MNDVELAPALPRAFLEHARWLPVRAASLWDPPAPLDDDRRQGAQEYVDRQLDAVQRLIFPFHRL
jgi:hypothetical protein